MSAPARLRAAVRARRDARLELARRPFWNGTEWSVAEHVGLSTWHYRPATAAERAAYAQADPAPAPAPVLDVARPAPVARRGAA